MEPKLIRFRKGKFLPWDAYNQEAESGDKMITEDGKLYRLEESSGWGKKNLGELYPRLIKPPEIGLYAVLIGGIGYWVKRIKRTSP